MKSVALRGGIGALALWLAVASARAEDAKPEAATLAIPGLTLAFSLTFSLRT